VVAHGDAGGGGSGSGSSLHGAGRRACGGGDLGGRGHADSHVTGVSCGGYDAHHRIQEIRRKKSSTAGENDGFPAFSARLRNLLLPEKLKPLGITKYGAKQDPVQWLICYALSIENAGGNNDTKCLYFPFCLDQAPLTWLESLEKYSIDKCDQLKEQFTSKNVSKEQRSGQERLEGATLWSTRSRSNKASMSALKKNQEEERGKPPIQLFVRVL
jgi:hypothetical protein